MMYFLFFKLALVDLILMKLYHFACRSEADVVKEVVQWILELANKPLLLDASRYAIGLKQVVDGIIGIVEQKKVLILGLLEMGGIGKLTLALELYNQLMIRFTSSCYIEDVREKVIRGGLENIQSCI